MARKGQTKTPTNGDSTLVKVSMRRTYPKKNLSFMKETEFRGNDFWDLYVKKSSPQCMVKYIGWNKYIPDGAQANAFIAKAKEYGFLINEIIQTKEEKEQQNAYYAEKEATASPAQSVPTPVPAEAKSVPAEKPQFAKEADMTLVIAEQLMALAQQILDSKRD